ncbi:hypothetical protein [Anatilimnocola floriformis]|uniref:hypothetical protein n=1 Tax=Anatilimnocola floriformis TaxID=2948575 RepID=UPI0020C5A8B4|nr:hypothetical protein [Anatilimnocola floriformis]
MKRESRAPLIVAIVLLLLPVVYVGSYLALVVPSGRSVVRPNYVDQQTLEPSWTWSNYRFGYPKTDRFFWPLEFLDRRVRPETWGDAPNWQDKLRSEPPP